MILGLGCCWTLSTLFAVVLLVKMLIWSLFELHWPPFRSFGPLGYRQPT